MMLAHIESILIGTPIEADDHLLEFLVSILFWNFLLKADDLLLKFSKSNEFNEPIFCHNGIAYFCDS